MALSRVIAEFKLSPSPAGDLIEPNRFSDHIPDGDLVFEGQVVEEARREPFQHDHVTWFRLLVFDTHYTVAALRVIVLRAADPA
jgi:hypothetical protein